MFVGYYNVAFLDIDANLRLMDNITNFVDQSQETFFSHRLHLPLLVFLSTAIVTNCTIPT